jgi:glycosyltransferase involved in cell wall biosynthesis
LIAGSAEWRACWETADVFVFPSRLETFGIVLLEALAFEVPIVSSRAGAAVSLLGDGRYGTLLESETVESLRDSIWAILESPDLYGERSRQGREWFEREFELGQNTERLAGWLHEAMGARS